MKLKKPIKIILLDIIQLVLITKYNNISINSLYNEIYFNICIIIFIIILEVIKNID